MAQISMPTTAIFRSADRQTPAVNFGGEAILLSLPSSKLVQDIITDGEISTS